MCIRDRSYSHDVPPQTVMTTLNADRTTGALLTLDAVSYTHLHAQLAARLAELVPTLMP